MVKSSRRCPPPTRPSRFCWRERTERLNWRLITKLHLADVVRRGDPTVLEPYALHLTFAQLPVIVSSLAPSHSDVYEGDLDDVEDSLYGMNRPQQSKSRINGNARNAWFLVRILQLAMEYLLFLRTRDTTIVETLQQELLACEEECDLALERVDKWKLRARSNNKQAENLHQMLQNISKLLQVEGATPSAIATIESLLWKLVPRNQQHEESSREDIEPPLVKEARVCGFCGKLFSSADFLEKHMVRRHAGEMQEIPNKRSAKSSVRSTAPAHRNNVVSTDILDRQVEQALQQHQTSLRAVAQQESDKLQRLYEHLHVETKLGEELRMKRQEMEIQLADARRDLELVHQEKEKMTQELQEMREQLQFLALKKKMESVVGENKGNDDIPSITHDSTMQLELKRVEQTLTIVNTALATSRVEFTELQDRHQVILKEKHQLEVQLQDMQNHINRMETSLRSKNDPIPSMKRDVSTQTEEMVVPPVVSRAQIDAMVQTVGIAKVHTEVQTVEEIEKKASTVETNTADKLYIQEKLTILEDLVLKDCQQPSDTPSVEDPVRVSTPHIPAEVFSTDKCQQASYASPMDEPVRESMLPLSKLSPPPSPVKILSPLPDEVFQVYCDRLLDSLTTRSNTVCSTVSHPKGPHLSSLPRHKFLRSFYQHKEEAVNAHILSWMDRLEQKSQGFGVIAKNQLLSLADRQHVQQALHSHLRTLPTNVLERMVEVEQHVNTLIQNEWIPEESSRKLALQRLVEDMELQSQRTQDLVRKAMASFRFSTSQRHPAAYTPMLDVDSSQVPTGIEEKMEVLETDQAAVQNELPIASAMVAAVASQVPTYMKKNEVLEQDHATVQNDLPIKSVMVTAAELATGRQDGLMPVIESSTKEESTKPLSTATLMDSNYVQHSNREIPPIVPQSNTRTKSTDRNDNFPCPMGQQDPSHDHVSPILIQPVKKVVVSSKASTPKVETPAAINDSPDLQSESRNNDTISFAETEVQVNPVVVSIQTPTEMTTKPVGNRITVRSVAPRLNSNSDRFLTQSEVSFTNTTTIEDDEPLAHIPVLPDTMVREEPKSNIDSNLLSLNLDRIESFSSNRVQTHSGNTTAIEPRLSRSIANSSEVSFNESIPSLDGSVNWSESATSQSFPNTSEGEISSRNGHGSEDDNSEGIMTLSNQPPQPSHEENSVSFMTLANDQSSDDDNETKSSQSRTSSNIVQGIQQTRPRPAPITTTTSVTSFDDSDIEEVSLL